jgi:hypothetical protein
MLQRPSQLSLTKSILVLISYIPLFHSLPVQLAKRDVDGFPEEDPASAAFWWKLGVSLILVILGGVFAGMPDSLTLLT